MAHMVIATQCLNYHKNAVMEHASNVSVQEAQNLKHKSQTQVHTAHRVINFSICL